MTTLITRDQMRPGQIVARVTRQRYRVLDDRWPDNAGGKRAGLLKTREIAPPETTWELVRRWHVRPHQGPHPG